jgi:arabinose-5-phosphate isomerase
MNAQLKTDPASLIAAGRRALEIEGRAIGALVPRLDAAFARACAICLESKGRVIVSGMGKSGHIAGKIAATFASTGTPSFFMHAAEASHGDIGMITRDDVLLAISNSGETAEVLLLIPHLSRLGVPIISLTGNAGSSLAKASTVHLDVSVAEEACPLNLAPTASTTATLAIGDALAVALLEARGFTSADFARSHPGGALGRKLLLHVADVMRTGDDLPVVGPAVPLAEGLVAMSKKGLGMCVIVEDGRMLGVFTDGDLRRVLDRETNVHKATMREVMTSPGKRVTAMVLAAEAAHLMEKHKITALPVVDDHGTLVGALNVHDLLRAGVL